MALLQMTFASFILSTKILETPPDVKWILEYSARLKHNFYNQGKENMLLQNLSKMLFTI